MPIFEYECLNCGKVFEELVLKKDEVIVCPACDCPEIEKKISVSNFKKIYWYDGPEQK
jgi:putative FmdB family regulatory protein